MEYKILVLDIDGTLTDQRRDAPFVAVGGDLGHASLAPTLVVLGDDPAWSRPLRRCSERLDKARRTVDQCAPLAGHLPPDANDCARRLARARREAHILEKQRAFLQAGLERARERQPHFRQRPTGGLR